MSWHLKDQELEKKLIAIDPDFVGNLQKSVKYYEGETTIAVGFGDGIGGLSRFVAEFRWGELEEVQEYDTYAWKEYPKVKPVEPGIYRLEVKYSARSSTQYFAAVFDFTSKNGWYEHGQGRKICTDVANDGFVRFRPWEY